MAEDEQGQTGVLDEIVRRIVRAVDPEQVILFGSRARGEAGPRSDYDILIVAPSSLPPWKRTVPVYALLGGMGVPKDVLWRTREEVEEWGNVKSHFVTTAMREGRVLYERAS